MPARRSPVVQRKLSPSPSTQRAASLSPSVQHQVSRASVHSSGTLIEQVDASGHLLPPPPATLYSLNVPVVNVAEHDVQTAIHGFVTAGGSNGVPEFIQGSSSQGYDAFEGIPSIDVVGASPRQKPLQHAYSSMSPDEWETYFASDEWLSLFPPQLVDSSHPTSEHSTTAGSQKSNATSSTTIAPPVIVPSHQPKASLPPYPNTIHAPAPVHVPYYSDVSIRRSISPDKLSRTATPWSPQSVISDEFPASAWSPGSSGPERTRMSQKEIEQRASQKLGLAWKRLIAMLGKFGKESPKLTRANCLNVASQVLEDAHGELETLRAENAALKQHIRMVALHLKGRQSQPTSPSPSKHIHALQAFPNAQD